MRIRQDGEWCEIDLTYESVESYRAFLKVKSLPQFSCTGRTVRFPARFLHVIGGNAKPIEEKGQVSRNQWIDWAEACWSDIRETNTLNTKDAKGEDDTKHICPLQLDVIERCIRLYSDPNEIVFSPFTGIGSEGYMALKLGRRFYGTEIKDEYFRQAIKNLNAASEVNESRNLLFT